MNLLLGLVIGVLLTIGTAFIADAFTAGEVTSETCSKQIVNWDVAKERLHDSTASIQTRVGSSQKWLAEPRVVPNAIAPSFFSVFLSFKL